MTSEVVSPSERPPISVGLLSRHSLLGGAVVFGVAIFYIVAIPIINGLLKGENPLEVGQPYTMFDSYQITPQEGWEVEDGEVFVTITKAGSSLVFTGPVPADKTPEEAIETGKQGLEEDASDTWEVGEPTTFVTDAGDHGASVSGHTAETALESWVITDGTSNVTVLSSSPSGVWISVADEMEAMVKSIDFLSEGDSQ